MPSDILSKGGIVAQDRSEKARLAVSEFRRLQPTLSAYARALTGKKNVRVEVAARDNGSTDGTRIFFRPPIAMGDRTPHERAVCDVRDSAGHKRCPACALREEIMVTIMHEIAHIAFDSFQRVSEDDKRRAIEFAVKETRGEYADRITQRIKKAPPYKTADFLNLASLVNEFLPIIINGLEDARVNAMMFKARPGLEGMFYADTVTIFEKGFECLNTEGEPFMQKWSEAPLNSQIIVGCFVKASHYKYTGWFHPEVEKALDDVELTNLTNQVDDAADAAAIYNLSFKVLARLRELGFCGTPQDPDPEPEPEPEEEESDEQSDEQGDSSEDAGSSSDEANEAEEASPETGEGEGEGDEGDNDPDSAPTQPDSDSSEGVPDSDGSDEEAGKPEEANHSSEGGDLLNSEPDEAPATDGEEVDESDTEGDTNPNESEAGSGDGDESGGDWGDQPDDDSSSESDRDDGGEGDSSEPNPDGDSPEDLGEGDEGTGADGDLDLLSGGSDAEDGDPSADRDDTPTPDDRESDRDDSTDDADKELVDTGADDGYGGTQTDAQPEFGTPEEVKPILLEWGQHEEKPKHAPAAEAADEAAVDVAIIQGMYFTHPSTTVLGVQEHYYDNPTGLSRGWMKRTRSFDGSSAVEMPDDVILQPAIGAARRTFSDNQRGGMDLNRKSGRVDARVLGKRAHVGDERLFYKRIRPGKKSYFVVIGVDMSGSTYGVNIALEKKAVMAQAELLSRVGIPFAIYGHTGNYAEFHSGLDLDIYHIKDAAEPWNDKTRVRLHDLHPCNANLDGHALEYLRKRADESTATEKIILYYSDGKMPQENHDEELEILQENIRICKAQQYTLLGVGIRTDSPVRHGLDTVQVDSSEDITKVVEHLGKRLKEK